MITLDSITLAAIVVSILLFLLVVYLIPRRVADIQRAEEEEERVEKAKAQLQSLNTELAINLEKQKTLLADIDNYSNIKAQMADSIEESAELMRKKYGEAEEAAKKIYQDLLEENANKYSEAISSLCEVRKELESQKASARAYIETLKAEESDSGENIITLNSDEESDVSKLNTISKDLRVGELSLNKMIWETYYKDKATELLNNLAPTGEKISCIYKITEIDSGKIYVGQTNNLRKRILTHMRAGVGAETANSPLYKRMRQVGPQSFKYEILEKCPADELNNKEKYWIDFYNSTDYGFNATTGGAASKGNN